jgi:hypothetical protein
MAKICLGAVAETLSAGGEVLSHIVLGACLIIGISLIVLAGVYYQGHRHNAKMVPLSKPVLYLVLGLLLLSIPFLDQFIGETGRASAKKIDRKAHPYDCYDIDAPIR